MPKAQLRDKRPEPERDLSDDLEDEVDEGMTKEAIIKMLLQVERPAGKKPLGRSAAFQSQKEARYAKARKNAKELVREGIDFLEITQQKLTDLRAQENSFEKYYHDCQLPLTAQQESVERAQMLYPPLIQNLGLRRSDQVDAACSMLKNKGFQRQEVLKEFSKRIRVQLKQIRQKEKDAADAKALIENYKALLRS